MRAYNPAEIPAGPLSAGRRASADGIRRAEVLSNVTVAAMASYPKLIAATDNAIIPAPSLDQKRRIILNTAELFRGLGVVPVRVVMIAAMEKVSDAMPGDR